MKKLLFNISILCGLIFSFATVTYAYESVDVYVNGYKLITDQPAIIYQDRTMVPIRAICEALGCDVEWDDATQTAYISNDMTILAVEIDNYNISKKDRRELDGEQISIAIDVPPIIYNSRTLVPVRAIAEMMNAIVVWEESSRSVKITSTDYEYISEFDSYGIAQVLKNDKWGYINKSGDLITDIKYALTESFFDGLAKVTYGDGGYRFINIYGDEVIGYTDLYCGVFHEGLCWVANDNDKMGYMDKIGNIVIPMTYDWDYNSEVVQHFSGGIAPVQKNGKWGFINKNNKFVIPCQYSSVYSTWYYGYDGFIPVEKGNKWGIINQDGKIVIPFVLDDIIDFYSDYALVMYKGSNLEFYITDYIQSGRNFDEWISMNASDDEYIETIQSFQVIQGPTWVNDHYIWPNKPENTIYNCVGLSIEINTEKFIDRTNEVVVCVKPKDAEWIVSQIETVEYTVGDYTLDIFFDEPIDLEEFCCYPNVEEQMNGNAPWNLGNASAFYYISK